MPLMWGASVLNVLEAAVFVAQSRVGLDVTEGIRADFVLPWVGPSTRLFVHVRTRMTRGTVAMPCQYRESPTEIRNHTRTCCVKNRSHTLHCFA